MTVKYLIKIHDNLEGDKEPVVKGTLRLDYVTEVYELGKSEPDLIQIEFQNGGSATIVDPDRKVFNRASAFINGQEALTQDALRRALMEIEGEKE